MDFFELLKRRKSTRKFSGEEMTQENVSRILLAANGAPVGSNLYRDIHLTVVRNREILDRLSMATAKRFENRANLEKIAGDMNPEALPSTSAHDPFYGAPLVIFVSHRNQTVQPGIEFSNVACIVFSMHLAATEMGLGSVFIWGALESMREIPEMDNTALLNLPDGFAPLLGIAIGHPEKELTPRELKSGKIAVNYL
jgi:nitroreductase